jgi:NAD(P)-dependent dehydrogenase (short-subunit alcohol dehydrogenase family)
VLAFVPLAATAVYSSTKAAIHSYVLSQRLMLRDTKVRVLEIAPPWVRTDLINSREAELAMPLDAFIAETIAVLGTDSDESYSTLIRRGLLSSATSSSISKDERTGRAIADAARGTESVPCNLSHMMDLHGTNASFRNCKSSPVTGKLA